VIRGLVAALCLLASPALAAPLDIAVADGPLRPGRAVTVEVAATDPSAAPRLTTSKGTVRTLGEIRDGVWAWQLVPDTGPFTLVASTASLRVERDLVAVPWASSTLEVADRVEAVAGDPDVRFVVVGEGLDPEHLEVAVGEGRVRAVRAAEGPAPEGMSAVEVELSLDPRPFPRVVPVGVRDRRTDDAPAWTEVRLRSRPALPIAAEPGAELTLVVGERTYGPFVAGDDGQIDAVIDQYPGESVARARLVDDLGNETVTDMPLSSPPGVQLVTLVSGERLPGFRPPLVFLYAMEGDGRALRGAQPRCQTPEAELLVVPLEEGWVAVAPPLDGIEPTDLRVVCTVDEAIGQLRVPVTEGVPQGLRLRVWPERLRADFPVADVRVVLEDARGDRIDTAQVQVQAARGEVAMETRGGIVARGEYRGEAAVAGGSDTLVATWSAPPGDGAVARVAVGWEPGPTADSIEVHGRALDRLGRPLSGVQLRLATDLDQSVAVTGSSGYASAELGQRDGVTRVSATSAVWRSEALAPPGSSFGGPSTPDLTDAAMVGIDPGRVAGVSVEVDPPILRAGPGAVAWVYVSLEDAQGATVTDADLDLTVSEGTLGQLRARSDGRFVAEYVPDPGGRVREVMVTAESDGLRSATRLSVQPRVARLAFGPFLGWQTNFGEVSGPAVGADLDIRLRSQGLGEALMVRLGGSGYPIATEFDGGGETLTLAGSVIPLHAALLLRDDPGPFGLWLGGGGSVAMQRLLLRDDTQQLAEGTRWLVGPVVMAGASRRVLGGDAFVEARAAWLSGRTGDIGYSGNVGGLGIGLGWRVVY